jgi:hypothetical protein
MYGRTWKTRFLAIFAKNGGSGSFIVIFLELTFILPLPDTGLPISVQDIKAGS